jgi:hypothetical protein
LPRWFRNGSSSGKSRWLYTPALRSSDVGRPDARQLAACLRASPLLSQKVFQSGIVEHGICQKPFQLRVPVFQRLQPSVFRHFHAAELRFPFIDAGIADAVLAAKLRDRRASLVLLQKADDLLGCETAVSFSGPLKGPELISKWTISTGQGQSPTLGLSALKSIEPSTNASGSVRT